MFSTTPALILALMLLQGSPAMGSSSVTACEDLRRVELSLSPEAMREVCISPGLMTGFRFDVPVVVELQDDRAAFESSKEILAFSRGVSYRTDKTVAAELWMENHSSEPWMVAGGALVNSDGEEMTGLKVRQDEILQPNGHGFVIVEANAARFEALGQLKLKFWDANLRVVTLPRMVFP